MMQQEVLIWSQRWIQDWNSHNLDAILAHYSEDVEFTSPFVVKLMDRSDGKLQGKSILKEYFAKGLATYPDLRFELIQVLVGVDSVVFYYHSVGDRLAAEYMQLNSAGLVTRVNAHYGISNE
jgi:ketosteroid isomerase-like protein